MTHSSLRTLDPETLPPLDPCDPALIADPAPFWHRYRERDPVHRAPIRRRGIREEGWWLFRHRDVLEAFRSKHLSSDGRKHRVKPVGRRMPESIRPLFDMIDDWMIGHEPPKHTRLRSPVSRAFTPRVVDRILGELAVYTDRLLDRALANGQFDAARDFAMPLSVRTMAELLGIPAEDRRAFSTEFSRLEGTFQLGSGLDQLERASKGSQRLRAMFSGLLCARRAEPRGDLASGLAAIDEAELSWDERTSTCILLLGAAHTTTVRAFTSGLLALLRHPDQMELLRAGEVSMQNAVEELLRFDAWLTTRYAKADFELAGHRIRRGEVVMLVVGSANRDPEVFPEPDVLNLARNTKQHLSFGHGMHFCLGASLARAELQIAFAGLLRRTNQLRLGDTPIEWRDDGVGRGLTALSIHADG